MTPQHSNITTTQYSKLFKYSILISLALLPTLFFSYSRSTTKIAIAIYSICLLALIFDKTKGDKKEKSFLYWWIIFSLCSFFLATGISQIINESFVPNRLDSPSRLLFSSLIFYAVYRYEINFNKLLKIVIPLGTLFFLIYLILWPENSILAKNRWVGRLSLPAIDPILLSTWLTCYGLICLSFIEFKSTSTNAIKNIIFFSAFLVTILVALITESRTSWLATPIYVSFLILKQKKLILKIGLVVIITLSILFLINYTSNALIRINQAIFEASSYFNGGSKESSVGYRIDMGMLAFKALSLKPFFGWGEQLFLTQDLSEYLSINFMSSTLFLAKNSGFHNDFYAAIVRSGLLGAFAYISTFFTPLILFIHFHLKGETHSKQTCSSGIAIIITCIIASITVEILAYKYSVSIFGYLIAGIMAQVLRENQSTK